MNCPIIYYDKWPSEYLNKMLKSEKIKSISDVMDKFLNKYDDYLYRLLNNTLAYYNGRKIKYNREDLTEYLMYNEGDYDLLRDAFNVYLVDDALYYLNIILNEVEVKTIVDHIRVKNLVISTVFDLFFYYISNHEESSFSDEELYNILIICLKLTLVMFDEIFNNYIIDTIYKKFDIKDIKEIEAMEKNILEFFNYQFEQYPSTLSYLENSPSCLSVTSEFFSEDVLEQIDLYLDPIIHSIDLDFLTRPPVDRWNDIFKNISN